jgi:hypothetical protein
VSILQRRDSLGTVDAVIRVMMMMIMMITIMMVVMMMMMIIMMMIMIMVMKISRSFREHAIEEGQLRHCGCCNKGDDDDNDDDNKDDDDYDDDNDDNKDNDDVALPVSMLQRRDSLGTVDAVIEV